MMPWWLLLHLQIDNLIIILLIRADDVHSRGGVFKERVVILICEYQQAILASILYKSKMIKT